MKEMKEMKEMKLYLKMIMLIGDNGMRRKIRTEKDGKWVTYTCSVCENIICDIFTIIGTGYICEPDWNNIPEICKCGTRITNRQPILDEFVEYDKFDKFDKLNCGNDEIDHFSHRERNRRDILDRSEIYRRRIEDLENAISIDYFDMRVGGLRKDNFQIPEDIDDLRVNCIKRNISHIEAIIDHPFFKNDIHEKREIKEKLNILKEKHSEFSEKMRDIKNEECEYM